MNLGDYLIWEATNGLLLIPTVICLVMVVRLLRGQPVFTEREGELGSVLWVENSLSFFCSRRQIKVSYILARGVSAWFRFPFTFLRRL
jgi:hypothetical protein